MQYIYHAVPENLMGETLIPLFDLKLSHPALFEKEMKKYDDHPVRKELPYKLLKKLNCPRGEVLHFSPIHPGLIFQALKSVFPEGNRSVRFFEIPIDRVTGIPTILFDMNRSDYAFGDDEPDNIFDWIEPEAYREIKVVPEKAFEFYREWKDRGERGAPAWGKIPHILVRGKVSISSCRIFDWREAIE